MYTYDEVIVRKRRRLPHWDAKNGLYLVTFRLADSLPAAVCQRLKELHKDNPRQYRIAVEENLDRGLGDLILRRPGAAQTVKSALDYFNRVRYLLICWTIMPNHVHIVLQLLGRYRLAEVMSSLKRHTSREINVLMNRDGTLWQEDYFDTLIRSEAHFERAVRYVLSNPTKAGLENHEWTGIDSLAYSQILGTAPPPNHGGL